MKKKSSKSQQFLSKLHEYLIIHPQFRTNTKNKSEGEIQAEIRPIIISYLENYFKEEGFQDFIAKANSSFYWEGQEGKYGRNRKNLFASKNYPDFIITNPYLIAIEYKQSESGALIKQGLGQSMMHTLCEEFHFVYYLFHDQSKEKKIVKSMNEKREQYIINKMWNEFNIFLRIV